MEYQKRKMTAEEKAEFILKNYPEMFDFVDVIFKGLEKYDMNNWLLPEGKRMSIRENSDSMFHHLAAHSRGEIYDESTLDHLLHITCRALMAYTRRERMIEHKDDDKLLFPPKKFQHIPKLDDSNCIDINTPRKASKYYTMEEPENKNAISKNYDNLLDYAKGLNNTYTENLDKSNKPYECHNTYPCFCHFCQTKWNM